MKTEKKSNKKKILLIVGIVIAAAVIIALASPFLFYSGPSSMMPAKWTDAIYSQSVNVDFSKYQTVTVSGNLDGKDISATYTVKVENDLPVVTCTESTGDEAALAKLNQDIISNALLTFGKGTEIADRINAGGYGEVMCIMLQKYSLELWYGEDGEPNATSQLMTWNEGLALESYTVTTRADGAPVSSLTFAWN